MPRMSHAVMTAGFRRIYIRQSSTQFPNKFDAVKIHLEKNFKFLSAVSVISFGATSSVYFCGKIYEENKNSVMTMDIMKEMLRSMEALSALENQSVKEKLIDERRSYDEKLTNESALRLRKRKFLMRNYLREATYGSMSVVTHGSLCTFVSSFIDSSLHLAYIPDNMYPAIIGIA
jgi:hypothetical protein